MKSCFFENSLKNFLAVVSMISVLGLIITGGCASNSKTNPPTSANSQVEKVFVPEPTKIDGLFGAKWHMTSQQLLAAVGDCKKINENNYMQIREYFGRKAAVNFVLDDGKLKTILISFMESYDPSKAIMSEAVKRFDETQVFLEKEFGVFTTKNIANDQTRRFLRVNPVSIRVEHLIERNDKANVIVETVMFYLWNGK